MSISGSKPLRWRLAYWIGGPALLIGAFFIPQEIPLEWYPLNEPGNDIHYLEIKCASDKNGWVEIRYDLTQGFNELHSIRFPISPTEETYTYTFPLPDGPLIAAQLIPPARGGTLKVDRMRIINRREEVVRSIPADALKPQHQIAGITAHDEGWSVTSEATAQAPLVAIDVRGPVVPVGMSQRNLLRCLLSTGYLAGMLSLIILAVTFAFWRPAGWVDLGRCLGKTVLLALPLATIGNRGLIRNTIEFARYDPPVFLEITLETTQPTVAEVFTDTGFGFRATERVTQSYANTTGEQTLRFPLADQTLRGLRFDPHPNGAADVQITSIRVVDHRDRPLREIPLDALILLTDIATHELSDGRLAFSTTKQARDPILGFSPESIEHINRAISSDDR